MFCDQQTAIIIIRHPARYKKKLLHELKNTTWVSLFSVHQIVLLNDIEVQVQQSNMAIFAPSNVSIYTRAHTEHSTLSI